MATETDPAKPQRLTLHGPEGEESGRVVPGLVEAPVAALLQHAHKQVEAEPDGPEQHQVPLQPLRARLLAGPLERQVRQSHERRRAWDEQHTVRNSRGRG